MRKEGFVPQDAANAWMQRKAKCWSRLTLDSQSQSDLTASPFAHERSPIHARGTSNPAIRAAGWGVVEGSKILREHHITTGASRGRGDVGEGHRGLRARDRNTKLAVIEAKLGTTALTEGVGQAKTTRASWLFGSLFQERQGIYAIDMERGKECLRSHALSTQTNCGR